MALYRQGKAAMDANGIVTGIGTNWQSALTLIRPGATILFLSSPIQMAVVNKVVSDTQINAITTNGAVVPSSDYAILLSDSLTVDGLAQDVAETLRYYQSQETVIAEAVDFFKDFDLATLQELVEQVKEDAAASHESASASQEAASASHEAASESQEAASASQEAAAASQDAAADAEATRDEIQQIIDEAGEQSTLVVLAQPQGLMKIGSAANVSALSSISPTTVGQRIQVTEYATGYVVGGGNFIVQNSSDYTVDGGKVVASATAGLVFVREEYYASRIVKPEWYGCRGKGTAIPDTIPFKTMLGALVNGDYIQLMTNAVYYNGFPNNSQALDGWVIAADNITLDGGGATLSRATPSSASYSGFTNLKLTGDNPRITGTLLITSDDPTNKPLYAYRSTTKIDSREIFTAPLANTLGLWIYGSNNPYVGKSVTLERAVFPFFANKDTKGMKVYCTARKSGQIYPQPTSASSDLALGSTFKLDACYDFIMDVIANDSAYAGIESESNNVNGSITLVTNKAYHAGLHLWNRCKNITYKVSATDIVEGGGVITGYGCEACSGDVTVYNAQYVAAFIGNSETTPVISCNVKGSGYGVTDAVVFFTTAANNAYIQHCNVDITAVHADVFSIGTARQSAIKFNGGQHCDIKVNAKDFDYIFSLGMGTNNKFNATYNGFNVAFSYSDQRSFDNEYRYTDPTGNVYILQAKGSSFEYRSDAVTNPIIGFKPLNRKQIDCQALVNQSMPTSSASVGGFYYDPVTKQLKINL
ncbi:putative tail fiber protein [Klebsiella phage PhiKpNIH-2]|uniref:Putative tail fiber protein n=1 Tax=Klebsiella phage PhiKpNIH-2 TaxID=2689114 RepID=A0A6B9M3Y3_9CAUD|nr:tail fiber protein [Klebsiella phage PhiKpNIH-2]QHB49739.1 putative tail fiber protein [Klebsiella phage PhiKpNIH-2]